MDSFKNEVRDHVVALYETVREELQSCWQFAREAWVLIVLLLAAIGTVIWLAKPAPPTHVLMGTGSAGGSYEELAKQYAEYFKKNGVTLELVRTEGAEENIKRLKDRDDRLQAAFIQGGLLTSREEAKGLLSLGSVGYEPLWIFYRSDLLLPDEKQHINFLSQPISIGTPGSGTYLHATRLLQLNHIELSDNFKLLSNEEAVEAFKNGTIHTVVMVDGLESKNVQAMINDPRARLTGFHRAEAFGRLFPIYHVLSIPEGSLNLVRNEPPQTIQTIAPTTNLVIDPNMHPAIQLLFLQAAEKINGGRSFFASYGEFPDYKESIIEESDVAKSFYKNGAPRLLEYMPFWLAEFLNRMLILLLPLGAFAYPIIKSMPAYRLSRARSRINEVYGALKLFEQELETNYDPAQHDEYLKTIDELDKRAQKLRVPRSIVSDYYSLRTTIDFVRTLIERPVRKGEA
ncbi:TAXI family TRAP transporter solute-binding subunit [Zwartia panacis]|uniref:TAXI family TRAP transporter solute-binding subunit n=1 Tax=Zwartia panacis TaxID=2683345 RepID=UPI0025B37D07|nr:TAXI family TRAP transporter solute-binding subunit [Zwartia panacis]MDN4016563.1 TAXI family TRAP transporter solute-binding subunit [Zwartia panacis]